MTHAPITYLLDGVALDRRVPGAARDLGRLALHPRPQLYPAQHLRPLQRGHGLRLLLRRRQCHQRHRGQLPGRGPLRHRRRCWCCCCCSHLIEFELEAKQRAKKAVDDLSFSSEHLNSHIGELMICFGRRRGSSEYLSDSIYLDLFGFIYLF